MWTDKISQASSNPIYIEIDVHWKDEENPDPNYRITNIRKLISALPDEHKFFLKELFRFLLVIAKNSAVCIFVIVFPQNSL